LFRQAGREAGRRDGWIRENGTCNRKALDKGMTEKDGSRRMCKKSKTLMVRVSGMTMQLLLEGIQ